MELADKLKRQTRESKDVAKEELISAGILSPGDFYPFHIEQYVKEKYDIYNR